MAEWNFVSIWQLASGSTPPLEVLQLGRTSKEPYHGHIPPDENTVMETGCARLHKAWLTEGGGLKKAFECNSSNSCIGLLTLSTILLLSKTERKHRDRFTLLLVISLSTIGSDPNAVNCWHIGFSGSFGQIYFRRLLIPFWTTAAHLAVVDWNAKE